MRAVVDTNIFVRALIKPEGTVRAILERLLDQTYTPLYSEPMPEELRIVFGRPRIRVKYGLADEAWRAARPNLRRRAAARPTARCARGRWSLPAPPWSVRPAAQQSSRSISPAVCRRCR
jgi:predicted nucleic acid-binding protein